MDKDSFTLLLLAIHVGRKIIRENKIEVICRNTDCGHGSWVKLAQVHV
jgi:hypothetical protein